ARPEGPAVACRVRSNASDALVEVDRSYATAARWVALGKISLPVGRTKGKSHTAAFADALAEGILNRLVRTQLTKGPREKGKLTYQLRIDNASPLILNGLALLRAASRAS